jgi:hypothetical protein
MRRALAVLMLAAVVVGSLPVGAVAVGATSSSGATSPHGQGLVGVPDGNIQVAPDVEAVNRSMLEGNVMASQYAGSMSVRVAPAEDVRVGPNDAVLGGGEGEVALVLTDNTHHDGRTVAVPSKLVYETLGYLPEAVWIHHEDGGKYAAPTEKRGDLLVFDVEEFSTNTVEFSGQVQLGGTTTDGSTFSYDLTDRDAVNNFTVNVTGMMSSEWDNESAGGISSGGSFAISPAGNLAPVGPSSSDSPVLSLTGSTGYVWDSDASYGDTGATFADADGTSTLATETDGETVSTLRVYLDSIGSDDTVSGCDVYVDPGSEADGTVSGTKVASDLTFTRSGDVGHWTTIDMGQSITLGTDYTEVSTDCSGGGAGYAQVPGHFSTNYCGDWISGCVQKAVKIQFVGGPGSITAEASDGTTVSFGDFSDGETKTAEFPVGTTATNIALSGDAGTFDAELKMEERTRTVDPAVEINNNTASHSGSLSDGETAALSVNESWIQDGTNTVNVSTGQLSGDAPPVQVGLDYDHGAVDREVVEYTGEAWTERYNISHTFASSRTDAAVTVPFDSGSVVSIRDVEVRRDGGSWSSVQPGDYSLSATTMRVELGDVAADETVRVRANGSKVRPVNGAITVLEPTVAGNSLETRVRLDSWGSDSRLDVSGAPNSRFIHYTVNESWPTPKEGATVTPGEGQTLEFPNAPVGGTARVETMPLDPDMSVGEVVIQVESAGYEPRFRVRPGEVSGQDVTYTWAHDSLTSGQKYILRSISAGKVVDSDTAQSPVTFYGSDQEQTLVIEEDDSSSGTVGSGGSGFWSGGAADASSAVREFAPITDPGLAAILAVALLVGGVLFSRRTGSSSRPVYRRPVVLVSATGSVGLLLFLLAPSAVAGPIQTALEVGLPLLAIIGVGIAALLAWGWYRARQNESKPPTIQVVGRDD